LQKDAFTPETRRFPLAFPYPFAESDEITMQLPKGYSVEQPPYRRKAALAGGGYEISSKVNEDETELITQRSLRLGASTFPVEQYPDLKVFFKVVLAGDTGQAILRAGPLGAAEKQN
jgi:hypothetical protein